MISEYLRSYFSLNIQKGLNLPSQAEEEGAEDFLQIYNRLQNFLSKALSITPNVAMRICENPNRCLHDNFLRRMKDDRRRNSMIILISHIGDVSGSERIIDQIYSMIGIKDQMLEAVAAQEKDKVGSRADVLEFFEDMSTKTAQEARMELKSKGTKNWSVERAKEARKKNILTSANKRDIKANVKQSMKENSEKTMF